MAAHSLQVTFQIRQSTAENWTTRNPILFEGEFGLEIDTFLIKVGDGVRDWAHLPYLNKLNATYFKHMQDGSLTFSDTFAEQINNLIAQAGGDAHLVINDDPTEDTDPVNYSFLQRFIADAIAHAGHLKRQVVEKLPELEEADENTIYLMPSESGVGYDEYMIINGIWDLVGVTNDGGSGSYELPVATEARLGGVRASSADDRISVTQEGFMTLNRVSTSKLYVPTGDTLILYGGTA